MHWGNNSENPHFMTQRGSAAIKHYAMPMLYSKSLPQTNASGNAR